LSLVFTAKPYRACHISHTACNGGLAMIAAARIRPGYGWEVRMWGVNPGSRSASPAGQ
jgi:hypothetical protein